MTDLSKLAAKLTKAQKDMLLRGSFPSWQRESRETRVKNTLTRRGICSFTHVIGGFGDFHLTPLGLALKAHLEQETEHETGN